MYPNVASKVRFLKHTNTHTEVQEQTQTHLSHPRNHKLFPVVLKKKKKKKKVVTNGPIKSVADVYAIPGLSSAEKDVIKKYESRFVTLDVKPEYDIDKINNGLCKFLVFFSLTTFFFDSMLLC